MDIGNSSWEFLTGNTMLPLRELKDEVELWKVLHRIATKENHTNGEHIDHVEQRLMWWTKVPQVHKTM
jgi:hypothetical protein